MGKPRYRWWGYALNVVEDYHRLVESTELMSSEYRERDAILRAIEQTGLLSDGKNRLALVAAVYWDERKRTIQQAADQVGIQEGIAKRWHKEFVYLVGRCLGFSTENSKGKRKAQKEKLPGDSKKDILCPDEGI